VSTSCLAPEHSHYHAAVVARKAAWVAVFNVIGRHLPAFHPTMILDVGANVGDTTGIFATRFPDAVVHAFEPVPSTFRELQEGMQALEQVRCHEVALSDTAGSAMMVVPENPRLARIIDTPEPPPGTTAVAVRSSTGDAFCAAERIDVVDFLKVDTEGHDLAVLRGFGRMLAEHRVGLIDVEVGTSPDNDRHVPHAVIAAYLEGLGYQPFWLHERTMDLYFTGRPILRRVNAVFASQDVVDANTVDPRMLSRLDGGTDEA
jgi:FkbM family methyltransferase